MLQLTRRAGESLLFGAETTLTVLGMNTAQVEVELKSPDLKLFATLKQGANHGFDVDGHRVKIVLMEVSRGEARFGLNAPQDVKIMRTEKLSK